MNNKNKKLKLQAIETEIYNCFENVNAEEFIAISNKTPEQGFLISYKAWNAIKEEDMLNEIIETYGVDYLENIFLGDTRSVDEIEKIIEEKLKLYNVKIK